MLVANHSAGIGLAELLSFACLYAERFGDTRPLAAFAHAAGFRIAPLRAIHRELGCVPSTYEAAYATLRAGVPLLVFPGGDHESLQPIFHGEKVDFGGRRGFLRIARESGVAIVPMGIRGARNTAPILYRARWLADVLVLPRLLGTKRWGVSVLGVLGAVGIFFVSSSLPVIARIALEWLWLSTPLVFLPWVPARVRFRVGAPLDATTLFGDAQDDAAFARAYDVVVAAVQAEVAAP